jgi:hypothetical protein
MNFRRVTADQINQEDMDAYLCEFFRKPKRVSAYIESAWTEHRPLILRHRKAAMCHPSTGAMAMILVDILIEPIQLLFYLWCWLKRRHVIPFELVPVVAYIGCTTQGGWITELP